MRTALLVILTILAFCPTWSGSEPAPRFRGIPEVRVSRVTLDDRNPSRRRVGALTFLGGIRLSSDDRAFGGFSAMQIEGDRFLMLSDFGTTFRFRLGADWIPRATRFGILPSGPGGGWLRQHRDGESLAHDPRTGQLWIGFENANSIWRYSPGLTRAESSASPAAMWRWPENGGAEAMLRLRSGRFLVLAEDAKVARKAGTRAMLAFDRDPTDPKARSFAVTYLPPYGFSPTDAAELPDGRLLVLNRQFTLRERFIARLVILDIRRLKPEDQLRGKEIATFAGSVIHDNFEALAITREGDDTIVWIASDNNAPTWLQHTLLLKFRLDLPRA